MHGAGLGDDQLIVEIVDLAVGVRAVDLPGILIDGVFDLLFQVLKDLGLVAAAIAVAAAVIVIVVAAAAAAKRAETAAAAAAAAADAAIRARAAVDAAAESRAVAGVKVASNNKSRIS